MRYLKHTIFLFFILYITISCSDNNDNNKTLASEGIHDSVSIPDTLSEFLENIHAREKAKAFNKYFKHLNRAGIFNGNVLIAQKGVVIFENSYGYSDIRKRKKLSLDDRFQIASVSKQFTAISILQLYEKGKLDLKDTIQKFIPDFPYKGITIHMLLIHKSGLPNYIYLCDKNFHNKDTGAVTNDEAIDCLIKYKPPRYYRPGQRFDYSNTGYMVLASIVERISKMPFEDYLQKHVFNPLSMQNTFVYKKGKTILPPNIATGYKYRRTPAEDIFLNGVVGDKGIYTTVEDLYKWDQGLYNNKIINDTILNLAFQPMGKRKWAHKNYGYGWRMYNSKKAGKILYHAGWWYGYQSLLVRVQKDTTTIVVLRNKKTKGIIDQGRLFSILYKDYK